MPRKTQSRRCYTGACIIQCNILYRHSMKDPKRVPNCHKPLLKKVMGQGQNREVFAVSLARESLWAGEFFSAWRNHFLILSTTPSQQAAWLSKLLVRMLYRES